jgi:hypothetical protein
MMPKVGRMVVAGVVVVALAGCAASASTARTSAAAATTSAATSPSTTSPSTIPPSTGAGQSLAISSAHGWQAVGDVDGDGHPDRARLVYLGGYGPDNWELVVDMTALGQQAVRFTGDPVLPGNTAAPTIAGSADATGDGHAGIFVKTTAGASTQFWTIFKLAGRQLRQVTIQGKPVRLAVNGSLTHQGGFRCDGARFVTVSEATEPPRYTTWTYQRDTYAWSGAELMPVSAQTGRVTAAKPGSPPAAYSGVSCGGLPQLAPAYTG